MPVKNNWRVVGGGGSVVGRFIQESPNFPFQVSVVNKREVGRPDKERGIWERRGQGRCKGRKAGICLPWKQERSRGWKQRLGEAPEEACNAAEGRISLGKTGGVLAEIERALTRPGAEGAGGSAAASQGRGRLAPAEATKREGKDSVIEVRDLGCNPSSTENFWLA